MVGGYPVVTVSIEEAKFHLYLSVTCAACIGTFEAGNVYFCWAKIITMRYNEYFYFADNEKQTTV